MVDNPAVRPRPRAGVLEIQPYVPGKAGTPGAGKVYKLSANESALGASPKAVAAFEGLRGDLRSYPDGNSLMLRQVIGTKFGVDPSQILCGAGSDEVLQMLAHTYVGPGDEGIVTQYGFSVHGIAIRSAGGTLVTAEEQNYTVDVDAILAGVTERTKIVFVANPGNPTGTFIPSSEIRRLHAGLPQGVLLVLDSAYAEYVRREDYESGTDLVSTYDNVVMTRTFSKIFGLANLRVGWLYAPKHVIEAVNRVRSYFNVNGAAHVAAAAALDDEAHIQASLDHNDRWMPWLAEELTKLGLKVVPSVCNFILVQFPSTPGKTASEANAFLVERGLILRQVDNYGLYDCLRITIGTEEANGKLVNSLRSFVSA